MGQANKRFQAGDAMSLFSHTKTAAVQKSTNAISAAELKKMPSGSIKVQRLFQNFTFQATDGSGFSVVNLRVQGIIACDVSIPAKSCPKLGSNLKAVGIIPYEQLGRDLMVKQYY